MAVILIRSMILFLSLFLLMRLMGKRQLGQLEPSELVVSVLIADLGAHPLQDTGMPMLYGLVSIVTIFCMELILSGMALRSVKLRSFLWGKPCFLIENGQINQAEMRKNRFSLDELTEELRRQSILDIKSVAYAVLETDGTLNVILNADEQPVTAGQMNIHNAEIGYPMILIDDGIILRDNLRISGRDTVWLKKTLRKNRINDPKDVFLLTVRQDGSIYLAKKDQRN